MKKTKFILIFSLIIGFHYFITTGFSNVDCTQTQQLNLKDLNKKKIVNTGKKILDAYVGEALTFDITGLWFYDGLSINLNSDNAFENMAGMTAAVQIEEYINSNLKKAGLGRKESLNINFKKNKTFYCKLLDLSVSGHWKTSENNTKIQLILDPAFKSLAVEGDLKATLDGCEILFKANHILDLMKVILKNTEKFHSNEVKILFALLNRYKKMQLGIKLSK